MPQCDERERSESKPVEADREQKHAQRSGCERIDNAPEHPHDRRLPIAELPCLGLGIDITSIRRDVAGIEGQHGYGKAGSKQQQQRVRRGVSPASARIETLVHRRPHFGRRQFVSLRQHSEL
jgi:hypothetical protein